MMILGTPDMVVVPGRVHGRAGRSRDRLRQIDCNRLCGGCYQMAADEMVPTWPVLSTPIELSAAAAARQEWHDDEPGPDQVGPGSRQMGYGLYACSSTGRYDGRR